MKLTRSFSPKLILPKRIHKLFREEMEDVRAEVTFQEAIRAGCVPYRELILGEAEPWFAKYIGDLGNNILEGSALYFHLATERDGKGSGATLGKLQLLAFVHGFASPRRVTMYVKRMVQIGRLTYDTAITDRRIRRLIPSTALIETSRNQFLLLARSADLLWPGMDIAKKILSDESYFLRVHLEYGDAYVEGADPVRPFDEVRHFTSKDAGTFLMNSMLTACIRGQTALSDTTEFAINFSDIARNCGVSRTHVRNVIEAAAERGLVVISGEGGRSLRFTRKFITSYERYYACLLILMRKSAEKVLAAGAP